MSDFEYRPGTTCYEYVVASLPVLSQDWKANPAINVEGIVNDIKEQCSRKDVSIIDLFLKGYEQESLTKEFYTDASKNENRFIKEFFAFDRLVRNCKVKYLNSSLGLPETEGLMVLDKEDAANEETVSLIMEVLQKEDLLERENALDALMWQHIDHLTSWDYFNMNTILGFLAKLKIIDRWLKLDEQKGREMFRKLVGEVKGTFKGVEFNDK